MNWHEWIEMNELKWMSCQKWSETLSFFGYKLKWTNWHEWIRWMNWNEWSEMNALPKVVRNPQFLTYELKWMKWNEWIEMHELTSMHWNYWIEVSELTWTSWNEWVDMNELKWMNWDEWIEMSEFSKVVRNPQFLMWNRALATVLFAFCRPISPIEPRNCRNRDPPSATTAATLPEKTQGFAPESVFKPAFTRSQALTLPNYLMMMMMIMMMMMVMMWLTWWCGWHDDVVDMMMWLTWWCGWHDDWDDVVAMLVRQLAMTIVRISEVS